MNPISKADISAVILAGGRASRMQGQDKGLILFNQKPLIGHVVDVVKNMVDSIWVSANRNLDAYQAFGQVISDELADYQGPLAGISSVLNCTTKPYLLILPCDGPYVQEILVERLAQTMVETKARACVAIENNNMHPTFALLHVDMAPALSTYLETGQRQLRRFFLDNQAMLVDFSDHPRMFVNLNSPEDFTTNA